MCKLGTINYAVRRVKVRKLYETGIPSVVSAVFQSVASQFTSTCVFSASSAVSAAVTSRRGFPSPLASDIRLTVWSGLW